MDSVKIHPRVFSDDSGLKFIFNHDGNHYTMRFSGRPLFIIEEWYYHLGGTAVDFRSLYERIRERTEPDTWQIYLVKEAIDKSTEMFEVLERIGNRKLSPFTIYAQPFDAFKFSK